jgi:NAD+ diphosphatase
MVKKICYETKQSVKGVVLFVKYCPECASKLENKLIDVRERLACSSPGCAFVYWDNPIPVVAALVQYEDKFILARNAKWPKDMFSLVTGFLERGETPEQAVAREVQEEIGLETKTSGFIGYYPFIKMNQIILAFWVKADGEPKTGDEIAEVKLLSREDLKLYDFGLLNLTSEIVQDWLKNR